MQWTGQKYSLKGKQNKGICLLKWMTAFAYIRLIKFCKATNSLKRCFWTPAEVFGGETQLTKQKDFQCHVLNIKMTFCIR